MSLEIKFKKYLNSKAWEYDNIEYTSILDKLIDKVNSTQYTFPRECSHGCFIKGAVHAHGTLDSYLMLGVNDKTQLNSDYSIKYIWKKFQVLRLQKNISIIIYIYIKDFNLIKKKTRKWANNYTYIINNFDEKSSIND